MGKSLRSTYTVLNEYCLRTPLFPIDRLLAIYGSKSSEDCLWELFESEIVKEALFIGSPELYKQIKAFNTEGKSFKDRKQRLSIAMLKYVTRLCSRPTPFGLFAGVAMGRFDNQTCAVLKEVSEYRRKTRLDFEFLALLSKKLETEPTLRRELKFYKNTSLYQSAGQIRYIETSFDKKGKNYSLQRIVPNEILNNVLQYAQLGKSYNSIVALIVKFGFEQHEAENYIDSLIGFQVLSSNLTPYSVGKDYMTHLMDNLQGYNKHPALVFLKRFKTSSNHLDKQLGNNVEGYKSLIKEATYFNKDLKINRFVQVDLYPKYKINTLSRNLKINISHALDVISALFKPHHEDQMIDFARAFKKRYGDRSMPLVDVLDLDYGIGYPVDGTKSRYPYLENLNLEANLGMEEEEVTLNKAELFLFDLLQRNTKSIDLASSGLSDFTVKDPNLKPTFFTVGQIIKENNETKIFIDVFGGSSACDLLGRFSHDSAEIRSFLVEIATFEKSCHKEKIIADIAHLPEDRVGNVLFRPKLRDYQINFLSGVNQDKESDININDLIVSMVGDQVVLKSKAHNKEIVPYLSNAHNYLNSELPLYRFICDYQNYNYASKVGFSWGKLPKLVHHLPRVTYKQIILSKEQWIFQTKYLKSTLNKAFENNETLKCINEWRVKEKLPQYIQLRKGDNLLLVDLKNELSLKMLLNSIPSDENQNCTLTEFLIGENPIVQDGKGMMYANEFVFALTKKNVVMSIRQTFLPGDGWLYVKLYSGRVFSDQLLGEIAYPLFQEMEKTFGVETFFFIRYKDPEEHIRLRFKISEHEPLLKALVEILQPYSETGILWNMEIATYRREIERYFPENIEICEKIFSNESKLVINLLNQKKDTETYILLALSIISFYVDLLLDGPDERISFLSTNFLYYRKEFDLKKNQLKELNLKYGNVAKSLDEFQLDEYASNTPEIEHFLKNQRILVDSIIQKEKIADSLIHMFVNRLFHSNGRAMELAMYHHLEKLYKTRKAKKQPT